MPEVETPNVAKDVVASLLENFDCQPVLFVGAGLARRYIGAPDWEGALRYALELLPNVEVTYEYLAQKHGGDKVLIGTEIGDLIFEWAWKHGKDNFPEQILGPIYLCDPLTWVS